MVSGKLLSRLPENGIQQRECRVIYKFSYSFGIIIFGLSLGYILQMAIVQGKLALPISIERLRKFLQKFALLVLNPVAIIGAVWVVAISSVKLVTIPFVGLLALCLGGLLSLGVASVMKLEPRKKGALFGCGSYTNIGSIGALICFVFLGEPGFALVPLYKIFEEVYYYSVGFPIAKYYSAVEAEKEATGKQLFDLLKDPFIIVAVSSLIIGGLLNFSGLQRPEIYASINAIFIPLATVILLVSIGLALKFRKVKDYAKECISVSVIKFAIVPVTVTSVAFLLGYRDISGGLPLKVVLVLSSMPVAFNALIPPSIYDLDLDLANSCWFVTTSLLVFVLPVLLFVIQFI